MALERERERESRNLNKKGIKLFARRIASVLVEKNNKEVNNLKDINKKDRLFYKNKVACPFCCLQMNNLLLLVFFEKTKKNCVRF